MLFVNCYSCNADLEITKFIANERVLCYDCAMDKAGY
jgi:hypothetical protein